MSGGREQEPGFIRPMERLADGREVPRVQVPLRGGRSAMEAGGHYPKWVSEGDIPIRLCAFEVGERRVGELGNGLLTGHPIQRGQGLLVPGVDIGSIERPGAITSQRAIEPRVVPASYCEQMPGGLGSAPVTAGRTFPIVRFETAGNHLDGSHPVPIQICDLFPGGRTHPATNRVSAQRRDEA